MKKSKTTILFIISSILLILSVGFFAFLFTVIMNKNIHTSAMQATLDEKIMQKQQGSILSKNIKEAVDDNKIVDSYFINPDSIDDFVSGLEKDSNSLGNKTSVSSVDFSKEDKRVINIGLSIEGSFVSVFKSIKMVESIPYIVNIKSLNINTNIANKDGTPAQVLKKGEVWYPWVAEILFEVYTF
ncbi:MAG: hypothetical protein WC089_02755 [Candidatus Paceibacterota bacterium]